jgi:hypothetical protein
MVNLTGARVGVHTEPDWRDPRVVICTRCGIKRTVHRTRTVRAVCRDCWWVDPTFDPTMKEPAHV